MGGIMSLQYCIEQARKLEYTRKQSRHYACITDKRGRIIVESANDYRCSHTQQFKWAKKAGRPEAIFLHSEMACLLKDKRKQGVKMFVARVDSAGNPCYSAPCEICALAIASYSNIKSVEFSV